MRPTTAASRNASIANGGASGVRWRPQSASLLDGGNNSPVTRSLRSPSALAQPSTPNAQKDKATASSDELIRDLEAKVRKVVEQKRAESDKLRFAVAKKRDDVEKAKLILQDLLKDSDALGLHYDLSETGSDAPKKREEENQSQHHIDAGDDNHGDDPTRLQPIASISRRPVYSKHTNIHELETKLERRAREAQLVHRRTLVVEHIKKRLLNERVEVAAVTNQLKQVFADLAHEAQEYQKKDIAATEAVSQVQSRLAQQKADMAASVRKFKRELALRHKWAREKAKFERYYNDQLQAVAAKAAAAVAVSHHDGQQQQQQQFTGPPRAAAASSPLPGIFKHRRSSNHLMEDKVQEDAIEKMYRDAFQRIGVDPRVEAIDPEEIVRIYLAHEELRHELDAKHDESVERIAQLREQISKARSVAREDVPLSKRGTSQKIETKQLEISSVERQLATVVDQYMFVERTVRPIKIGLQQVLQNVSSATVNIDNMAALEKCLVESCEEMMRMLRAASPPPPPQTADPHQDGDDLSGLGGGGEGVSTIREDEAEEHDEDEPVAKPAATPSSPSKPVGGDAKQPPAVVSLESFTSPYNVRIAAKKREPYFVPGLSRRRPATVKPLDDDDAEENDFDVMDRAMVKRISSVVVCTSVGKKATKDKVAAGDTASDHLHY